MVGLDTYQFCTDCIRAIDEEGTEMTPGLTTYKRHIGYNGTIYDEFFCASMGYGSLYARLCYQSEMVVPTETEIRVVLDKLEIDLKGVTSSLSIEPPTLVQFKKMIRDRVDMTTCPVYSYVDYDHLTNGQSMGIMGEFLYDKEILYTHHHMFLRRWEELSEGTSMDPIKPFIKPDAHKKSKAEKGAYRLIIGVGITDNLVYCVFTMD